MGAMRKCLCSFWGPGDHRLSQNGLGRSSSLKISFPRTPSCRPGCGPAVAPSHSCRRYAEGPGASRRHGHVTQAVSGPLFPVCTCREPQFPTFAVQQCFSSVDFEAVNGNPFRSKLFAEPEFPVQGRLENVAFYTS